MSKKENEKILNVNKNAKNGIYRCPKCSSSEILFNEEKGLLECKYCGHTFEEKTDDDNNIKDLKGTTRGKWSSNIDKEFNNIITLKCDGCGADVVINMNDSSSARCQWCRSILSANDVVENGIIPDKILPFSIKKEKAYDIMRNYISASNNKNLYISKKFKDGLKLSNIYGVYLPYMVIDGNIHSKLSGIGKHNENNYIETYKLEREFDLYVDDLVIESSNDRKDINRFDKANNIINSVMPFDTENSLKFTANYLIGYNSEKRDLDIKELENDVYDKLTNIALCPTEKDKKFYDCGIEWKSMNFNVVGTKWLSYYLPVWIYTYIESTEEGNIVHYVAVNGRTGKVNGSMASSKKSTVLGTTILIALLISAVCIGFFGFLFQFFIIFFFDVIYQVYGAIPAYMVSFIIILPLFIAIYKLVRKTLRKILRNADVKFDYERKTSKSIENMIKKDERIS